jgi:hypothetical protein
MVLVQHGLIYELSFLIADLQKFETAFSHYIILATRLKFKIPTCRLTVIANQETGRVSMKTRNDMQIRQHALYTPGYSFPYSVWSISIKFICI